MKTAFSLAKVEGGIEASNWSMHERRSFDDDDDNNNNNNNNNYNNNNNNNNNNSNSYSNHNYYSTWIESVLLLAGWATENRKETGHKWASCHQEKEEEIQRSWQPVYVLFSF